MDETSFFSHEDNEHDEILGWAKANSHGSLQIICEYYRLRLHERGSTIKFHPLEHLQPLVFHRPDEAVLHIAGSTITLMSCSRNFEIAESTATSAHQSPPTHRRCRCSSPPKPSLPLLFSTKAVTAAHLHRSRRRRRSSLPKPPPPLLISTEATTAAAHLHRSHHRRCSSPPKPPPLLISTEATAAAHLHRSLHRRCSSPPSPTPPLLISHSLTGFDVAGTSIGLLINMIKRGNSCWVSTTKLRFIHLCTQIHGSRTVDGIKTIDVDLSNQVVRIFGSSPVNTMAAALEQTGRKARLIGQGLPGGLDNICWCSAGEANCVLML